MRKSRIISHHFSSDSIDTIADILYQDFYKKDKTLEKAACVFGGKRPALFLKNALAKKIKKSFIPPVIFSMDDFMQYIVSKDQPLSKISDLELYYLIYKISKDKLNIFGKKQMDFSKFLGWAKEIVAFIEQLDLEAKDNNSLLGVEKSAAIGYEIPESINRILENIVLIRREYHQFLQKNNLYSRGSIYLEAANKIKKENFSDFENIFFGDLFYLHQTEKKVVSKIYELNRGVFIFEGSSKQWPVLRNNSKLFKQSIEPGEEKPKPKNIKFYQGFDVQSQVCMVKELLKEIKDKDDTLILLPDSETVIPLLSEASSQLESFNLSLGYPLKMTSLAALFNYLFDASQSRKNKDYYSKDYLKVLKHPLVKNRLIIKNSLVTRVVVHKIEEALTGAIKSLLKGNIFVSLSAIEEDKDIFKECKKTLKSIGYEINFKDYWKMIKQIHDLFFNNWQKIDSFCEFSQQFKLVLDSLATHQTLDKFPLESKALDALYKIEESFDSLSFSNEQFNLEQIWDVFRQQIESTRISFLGSPLSGTQILGLLETRALSFKNVIVLDLNEGVLPKLKITEPLIPKEVMMGLGLPSLQKEEEIQRYHFMRLIQSAENVFLIWAKNQALEKSRFVEDIIWTGQKSKNKIEADKISQISFSLSFPKSSKPVEKNSKIIQFLKNSTYSASRVNTYLHCPLQFYYKYVLGLGEKEDFLEGIKDSQIGNFIHQLLFEAYSGFLGKKPIFDKKFNTYFKRLFQKKYEEELKPRMQSDSFLLKEIIKARLNKFIEEEKDNLGKILKIEALEKEYTDNFDLDGELIKFKYIVDRIDISRDNRLLIIDYKTGGSDLIPAKLRNLEKMELSREGIRDKIKSFQLPLYYHFIQNKVKAKEVNAYVYNLRKAERKSFISAVDYKQRQKVLDCCLKALKFILSQIFNPNVPFEADKDSRRCQYCSFSNICG
ncbi:MAG: PD-(D/E)XK nuclease family protein [Candidatus Omnitrophica bacterium]|nr:PD-(D/E)XK nuclease family protein [Candidatus Omnitrophota bacterium]